MKCVLADLVMVMYFDSFIMGFFLGSVVRI